MATTKTTATARKTDTTAEAEVAAKVNLPEMRKPLFAYLGAADFAVEKLRELPGRVGGLQNQVKDLPNTVSETLKSLPNQVTGSLTELSDRATKIYGDFANRGEQRVSAIRRNPATKEAVARTRTAVSRTKAAQTSTRKAASAVGKAASDAAATTSARG